MAEALIAALIGCCIGSALANIAWCWPDGLRSLASRRSACEQCGATLGIIDLIPVAGWFIRRGHCGYCAALIPSYYWQVELAAGIIAGVSVWLLGPLGGAFASIAGWVLLLLARIDLDQMILPDALTLPLLVAGLIAAWLPIWPGPTVTDAWIGAIAGYALLVGVRWAYQRFRGKEGLGLGDAKLFAAAGAWCGWEGLPNILFLAAATSLCTALIKGHKLDSVTPMPFGPSLAAAIWLQILWSWPNHLSS